MGKGQGCVPSKKKTPTSDETKTEDVREAVGDGLVPSTDPNAGGNNVTEGVETTKTTQDSPVALNEAPAEVSEKDAAKESTPSTSELVSETDPASIPAIDETEKAEEITHTSVKVFIVYYSMYGHVAKLAEKVKEGVDSVPGAEGVLFQVPETLPQAVLSKMGAPPKPSHIPVIEPKNLLEADAVLFGIPTRFGMMCAQMKAFFDATGSLWQSQALAGKPAGFFFSTGTQGGGQETTALTAISQLAHHGMLFVPVGYTFQKVFSMDVHGGSPYGAGTFAGDGTRMPLDLELDLAVHQGKEMGTVARDRKSVV